MLKVINKSQSKYIETVYINEFLPKYGNITYKLGSDILSNNDVLDCLENELKSSKLIGKLISGIIKKSRIISILIIGAGSGGMGNMLRKLYPDTKIYEIDINPYVISRLKKLHKGDSLRKPILGNACKLPVKSSSIDLVIGYSVFRYIRDKTISIKEIDRVLRTDGLGLIAEGKNMKVINKVVHILKRMGHEPTRFFIRDVQLPRLSFFYWLVSMYKVRPDIRKALNILKKCQNINYIQVAFRVVKMSMGNIYGIYWKRYK
jgi:ubiquinone/menaquinone biosynthesis C-methylase UbiE